MAALALTLTAFSPVAQAADPEPVAVAGVTIGGVDVAGMTGAQAATAVTAAYTSGLVRIHVGRKNFRLAVKRLDVRLLNLDAAVAEALAMTAPGDAHVVLTYDRPALIKAVNAIDTASRTKPKKARWTWKGRRPVAVAEKSGSTIDRGKLRADITAQLHKPTGREATAAVKKLRATLRSASCRPRSRSPGATTSSGCTASSARRRCCGAASASPSASPPTRRRAACSGSSRSSATRGGIRRTRRGRRA